MTHALKGRKQSPEHVAQRIASARAGGLYERQAERLKSQVPHNKKWSSEQEQMLEWRKSKRDHIKAYEKEYRQNNKVARLVYQRNREAAKMQRIPAWANLDYIAGMYELCGLFRRVGLNLEVDHIIPLQGKNVSGLHVEDNLQLLHGKMNRAKNNRFEAVA